MPVSVNGSRHARAEQESARHRRMNRWTSYGIAAVVFVLFKGLVTWILGITPDPMLAGFNLIVASAGVAFIMLGRKWGHERE
ncbi:MAG TPA: hypothetical protein VG826_26135 [Pirellulales bacterium]|nr:hypothetical protein [Pirellulales bacterium]